MAATVSTSETDLATIIKSYNEVTVRLKQSHEMLRAEVCRLHEELQEKNKALARRERLSALGEMAAGLAHEIRNPLGGIGLYASLLERDLQHEPKQLEISRRISAGVQSLEGLVGDVLAFAGDAPPHVTVTAAATLVDSAIAQVAPKIEAKQVTLDVDPALESVRLHCDAAQVERAMVNLLLNALDAVSNGGGIRIGVDPERDEKELFPLAVEDDGPGIPAESAERIFNPFFTTKDTGTGLGLPIVHRIAEAHGGRVVAANHKRGATFVLFLPRARNQDETRA